MSSSRLDLASAIHEMKLILSAKIEDAVEKTRYHIDFLPTSIVGVSRLEGFDLSEPFRLASGRTFSNSFPVCATQEAALGGTQVGKSRFRAICAKRISTFLHSRAMPLKAGASFNSRARSHRASKRLCLSCDAPSTHSSAASPAAARRAGKVRLEGEDHVVADADALHFRFANWPPAQICVQWPSARALIAARCSLF